MKFRGFNIVELGYLSKGVFNIASVHNESRLRTTGSGVLFSSPKGVDGVFLDPHRIKTDVSGIQIAHSYVNTTGKCLELSYRWESWHFG